MTLSFRNKLALTMGGLILAIAGFISFYFPRKLEREAITLITHKAETLGQLTAFTIHPAIFFEDRAALDEALSGARQDKDVAYVVVVDPRGRRLAEFHPERATIGALDRGTPGGALSSGRTMYEQMIPIRDAGKEIARLYIGVSLARVNREITNARIAIGLASLAILLIGIASVIFFTTLLTRPLREVAEGAKQIAAGELDRPVPVRSADEVGELALAFNDMAAKIAARNRSLEHSREQLRTLSKRLLVIQEEERIRIAREVHDQLGQALTALKIDLRQLARRDPESQHQVQALNRSVDVIIEQVRKISSELRPVVLDDLGLHAALEQQLRRLRESTGIRTSLHFSGDREFDMLTASTIFRIVQESLSNVVRHANATEVDVSLAVNSHAAVLKVRDNGRGITAEQIASPAAIGLIGMRERAELLNGTVEINGAPGRGTTVTFTLPLS